MEKDIKQKIETESPGVDHLEGHVAEECADFNTLLPAIRIGCYAYKSKYPDKSNSDIIHEVDNIFYDVSKASQNGDFAKYTVGLTEAELADFEVLAPNYKIVFCIYKSINPEKSYSEVISELDKTLSPPRLPLIGELLVGYVKDRFDDSDTSNSTFRQKIKRFFGENEGDHI